MTSLCDYLNPGSFEKHSSYIFSRREKRESGCCMNHGSLEIAHVPRTFNTISIFSLSKCVHIEVFMGQCINSDLKFKETRLALKRQVTDHQSLACHAHAHIRALSNIQRKVKMSSKQQKNLNSFLTIYVK